MNRAILFLLLGMLMLSSMGCNTLQGAGAGFAKDASTTWQKAKKADDWLQKNAW